MNPRIRTALRTPPLSSRLPGVEELKPLPTPLQELSPEARRLLASEGLGPAPIPRSPRRAAPPALPAPQAPTAGEVMGLLGSVGRLQGGAAAALLARRLPQQQLAALQGELQAVGRMAEAVAELAGLRRQVDLRRAAEGRG